MITGDKPNTAISIGRSTGIIDPKTKNEHVITINRENMEDYDSMLRMIQFATKKIDDNRMLLWIVDKV